MENMERRNQEPTPEVKLEEALYRIYEDQMLQFTDSGFRLYEYVETGETDIRAVKVGETEHVYRIPVKEPMLQKDVPTLAELFDPNEEDERYDDGHDDTIDTDEFRAWLESLLSPEEIQAAAIREFERRREEGDTETVPCGNCKGKMQFESTCWCTFGGTTFTDMTDESDGSTTRLRAEGEADPDCETCEGSGKTINNCPCCEGSGKAAKYPYIILQNEVTGEERILKLDLATLIVNGEVEVEYKGYEIQYPNDYQVSQKSLCFNVSDYVDRHIAEMGIDKNNAAIVSGERVSMITSSRTSTSSGSAWWRKRDGEVQTGAKGGEATLNADDALENAQKNISAAFAWPYGKIKDEEGVSRGEHWVMRPLRPIEETLADIQTLVAESGYTLGFTHSFIATGEAGPSFYLLDHSGNALAQLSNEYSVRESLENALAAFRHMQNSPPPQE
jgi:hypothetical protein